jgi:hypothetical protein
MLMLRLGLPSIPCSKSHVHIPSLGSFIQKILPGPRLCVAFRNEFVFNREGLLTPRPTQAGGSPLVVCPLLLLYPQYHYLLTLRHSD